ncbi:MAG: hypothetical protein WD426_19490 [Anditalea sp.]
MKWYRLIKGCRYREKIPEVGNPRYILDLLLSIINVSVQTLSAVFGEPDRSLHYVPLQSISISAGEEKIFKIKRPMAWLLSVKIVRPLAIPKAEGLEGT